MIRYSRDEIYFLAIFLSNQIKDNTLFKNIHERKIRSCDKNIHKYMQIYDKFYQRMKRFSVTVQPENACK